MKKPRLCRCRATGTITTPRGVVVELMPPCDQFVVDGVASAVTCSKCGRTVQR